MLTLSQCYSRVLIAYTEFNCILPTDISAKIRNDPDVTAVDWFDAAISTPTLGQLQQYDIVMLSSNGGPHNATALGDNLAAYVDGGGVVVECAYGFQVPRLQGRWLSGNYNPFD